MKTKIVTVYSKKRRDTAHYTSTLMQIISSKNGKVKMILADRESDDQIVHEFEEGEVDTLKDQIARFEKKNKSTS